MRAYAFNAFAGAGLLSIAASAGAQTATETAASPASNEQVSALEEVVVTARRKEEVLEDVPQTISVVTADTVQKLNILNFQDLQSTVPGVTMSADPGGLNDTVSMRGLSYSVYSQNVLPTVALYLNDAYMAAPQEVLQAMYDIGQVEVLRGPQGTLHGESAPSGAITLTTHRPDLAEFGGYADVTGYSENELHGPEAFDAQAAVNLPIIKDMLALRLAGVIEDNHLDLVRSLNTPGEPYSHTKSERATLRFEPAPIFDAILMYQHLENDIRNFQQVIGDGSAGGTFPKPAQPLFYTAPTVVSAGYNGPPITPGQRVSVNNAPNFGTQKYDFMTGQVDFHFAGQRLAYTGSYNSTTIDTITAQDTGNLLPGVDYSTTGLAKSGTTEHELRLMSEERVFGLFDYTIGTRYYREIGSPASITQQYAGFYGKAFGTGAAASPYSFNPADLENLLINENPSLYDRSVYANATAYLGDRTELSAGVRQLDFGYHTISSYNLFLGNTKVPLPFPNADYKAKSAIYNISLSHHFYDGLMVYATTGTAWRPGTSVIGPQNPTGDPTLNSLINLHAEYSHSYELGLKELFLDRRAQVNVAVYHQYFDGLVFQSQYAPYLVVTPIPGTTFTSKSVAVNNFSTNANSVVNGVDLDGAFRVTPRWTISGAVSYAKGHVDNASTPCTPSGVDINNPTVASFEAAVAAAGQPNALVYECKNSQPISLAPTWNASLNTEYSMPLTNGLDGFVRGLANYYPSNPNAVQGYVVSSYALFNLYLGLRAPESSWEASFFIKNLTDRTVLLTKSYFQIQEMGGLNAIFGNPGYYTAQVTPPMQVGVNLRYVFGSR